MTNLSVWISAIAAFVSFSGAVASWYWARKRLEFDAGRELGALRAEARNLIFEAYELENEFISIGRKRFIEARATFAHRLHEKEPLMHKEAYAEMTRLAIALAAAVEEAFPDEFLDDPRPSGKISKKTLAALERASLRLEHPHYLTRG